MRRPQVILIPYPDLKHDPPKGSHWDYKDPAGTWWECYPDGSVKQTK